MGIYVSNSEEDSDTDASETGSVDKMMGQPLSAPLSGAGLVPPTPMSAYATSQAASQFSTKSIKKLAAVGRRGTAFVGRQIQQRVNNFQGVGAVPRPVLRRAPEMSFDKQESAPQGAPQPADEGQVSLVTQHLRSQLSHDIWCIALALFVVIIIETLHTLEDPQTYSVFSFLFEIVSGYTNIGLSIGLPNQSFSFSGGWYTGSKLIMVIVMIRGRHRGLPVALDHAVKLPGGDNIKKQQEDADLRRSMSRSGVSMDDGATV